MTDLKTTIVTTVTDAINTDLAGKVFYKSKTFWTNIIVIAGMGLQVKYGYIITPELHTLLLAAVNLGLRYTTKEPVVWSN